MAQASMESAVGSAPAGAEHPGPESQGRGQPDVAQSRQSLSLGQILCTVASTVYLVLGTVFFGLIAVVVAWIPPRGRWMFECGRWWSRGWLWVSGLRVRHERTAELSAGQGYIYMANHASYFDIPLLLSTLPGQTAFMAKRSLFYIPVFGWALYAGGFIPVDRGHRERGRDAFTTALLRLRQGQSLLIFPEGGRTRDGRMRSFKRGALLLALRSGYPVVPVGLTGTRRAMPSGSLVVQPGPVCVRYGQPIDPTAYGVARRGELMNDLRQAIEELCGD